MPPQHLSPRSTERRFLFTTFKGSHTRSGAVSPGSEWSIPLFRAEFLSLTSKIVEHSRYLLKSLACLLPLVRSGKVALLSTANKALQEQLFYKDIPFIQHHIQPCEAALVKGIGNYVCLDRLEAERAEGSLDTQRWEWRRLIGVIDDLAHAFGGDFETLGFQLPGDLRSRVCGDSDQCAWSKCPSFRACYVRQMREHAQRAQVSVVNHTLLLLDAVAEGAILPNREVIVLDEAHHL